jgi:hypothetical protein
LKVTEHAAGFEDGVNVDLRIDDASPLCARLNLLDVCHDTSIGGMFNAALGARASVPRCSQDWRIRRESIAMDLSLKGLVEVLVDGTELGDDTANA